MERQSLPNNPDELTIAHVHQIGRDILKLFPDTFPPPKKPNVFMRFFCCRYYPSKGEIYDYNTAKKLADYPAEQFVKGDAWKDLVNILVNCSYYEGELGTFAGFSRLGDEINTFVEKAWPFKADDYAWISEYQSTLLKAILNYNFSDNANASQSSRLRA